MDLLAAELRRRGFTAEEVPGSRRNELVVRHAQGGRLVVRVKTRTAGTWQGTTNDADAEPQRDDRRLMVFVDLADEEPEFYVVPEWWYRQDLHRELVAYLTRHPRPRSSTHHAIPRARIAQWRDKWDLLEPS